MPSFTASLWRWEGPAAWHFLTLPEELAEDLRERAGTSVGFGAVRVRASIGGSTWATLLVPGGQAGGTLLPVKKAVRTAEQLDEGDTVTVDVELA